VKLRSYSIQILAALLIVATILLMWSVIAPRRNGSGARV
jgi:hypothetical protein